MSRDGIERLVRSGCPASTEGILIDLEAYPALVPGHGCVQGVLLDVDKEALVITDRIEGYEGDRSHNLFVRRESIVQLEVGQETMAWIYVFANAERIAGFPKAMVGCAHGVRIYEWLVQIARSSDP